MTRSDRFKDHRFLLGAGFVLFAISGLLRKWGAQADEAGTGDLVTIGISAVCAGVAIVFIVAGIVQWKKQTRSMDERFLVHRLKATRFAAVIGLLMLLGFQVHDAVILHVVRWDLLAIIAGIALAKVGAMIYYSRLG